MCDRSTPRTQKMSCLKVSRLSYTMAKPWHVLFQIVWPILVLQSKRSSHHYQTLGFRNSTFFPSYRPKVLMDEDDEISSVATDDTTGYPSVRLVNLAFSYDISILTYQSAFVSELNIQRVSENNFILWKLWRLLDVIYCCCVARKTAVKHALV